MLKNSTKTRRAKLDQETRLAQTATITPRRIFSIVTKHNTYLIMKDIKKIGVSKW